MNNPGRSPFLVYLSIVLSTLAFCEIILQIVRPEKLSIAADVNAENNLPYKYDATLGWAPSPNATQRFSGTRTINVHQNELGLRDAGLDDNIEGSIVFAGIHLSGVSTLRRRSVSPIFCSMIWRRSA